MCRAALPRQATAVCAIIVVVQVAEATVGAYRGGAPDAAGAKKSHVHTKPHRRLLRRSDDKPFDAAVSRFHAPRGSELQLSMLHSEDEGDTASLIFGADLRLPGYGQHRWPRHFAHGGAARTSSLAETSVYDSAHSTGPFGGHIRTSIVLNGVNAKDFNDDSKAARQAFASALQYPDVLGSAGDVSHIEATSYRGRAKVSSTWTGPFLGLNETEVAAAQQQLQNKMGNDDIVRKLSEHLTNSGFSRFMEATVEKDGTESSQRLTSAARSPPMPAPTSTRTKVEGDIGSIREHGADFGAALQSDNISTVDEDVGDVSKPSREPERMGTTKNGRGTRKINTTGKASAPAGVVPAKLTPPSPENGSPAQLPTFDQPAVEEPKEIDASEQDIEAAMKRMRQLEHEVDQYPDSHVATPGPTPRTLSSPCHHAHISPCMDPAVHIAAQRFGATASTKTTVTRTTTTQTGSTTTMSVTDTSTTSFTSSSTTPTTTTWSTTTSTHLTVTKTPFTKTLTVVPNGEERGKKWMKAASTTTRTVSTTTRTATITSTTTQTRSTTTWTSTRTPTATQTTSSTSGTGSTTSATTSSTGTGTGTTTTATSSSTTHTATETSTMSTSTATRTGSTTTAATTSSVTKTMTSTDTITVSTTTRTVSSTTLTSSTRTITSVTQTESTTTASTTRTAMRLMTADDCELHVGRVLDSPTVYPVFDAGLLGEGDPLLVPTTPRGCCWLCESADGCTAFTWTRATGLCDLKSGVPSLRMTAKQVVSGLPPSSASVMSTQMNTTPATTTPNTTITTATSSQTSSTASMSTTTQTGSTTTGTTSTTSSITTTTRTGSTTTVTRSTKTSTSATSTTTTTGSSTTATRTGPITTTSTTITQSRTATTTTSITVTTTTQTGSTTTGSSTTKTTASSTTTTPTTSSITTTTLSTTSMTISTTTHTNSITTTTTQTGSTTTRTRTETDTVTSSSTTRSTTSGTSTSWSSTTRTVSTTTRTSTSMTATSTATNTTSSSTYTASTTTPTSTTATTMSTTTNTWSTATESTATQTNTLTNTTTTDTTSSTTATSFTTSLTNLTASTHTTTTISETSTDTTTSTTATTGSTTTLTTKPLHIAAPTEVPAQVPTTAQPSPHVVINFTIHNILLGALTMKEKGTVVSCIANNIAKTVSLHTDNVSVVLSEGLSVTAVIHVPVDKDLEAMRNTITGPLGEQMLGVIVGEIARDLHAAKSMAIIEPVSTDGLEARVHIRQTSLMNQPVSLEVDQPLGKEQQAQGFDGST